MSPTAVWVIVGFALAANPQDKIRPDVEGSSQTYTTKEDCVSAVQTGAVVGLDPRTRKFAALCLPAWVIER